MSETYLIERKIEIDAGHRVTYHGSKCKNLHGHRYTVVAVCRGPLVTAGEQEGMVLDFGFLKEEMVREVHSYCDHAMIIWVDDPLATIFIGDNDRFNREIRPMVASNGHYYTMDSIVGALYLVNVVPTAENLAAHWFERLRIRVQERTNGKANLYQIRVFETPNCVAVYPG